MVLPLEAGSRSEFRWFSTCLAYLSLQVGKEVDSGGCPLLEGFLLSFKSHMASRVLRTYEKRPISGISESDSIHFMIPCRS